MAHFIRYARKPCSCAPEWLGARQAAAPEHAGFHAEVPAVLLHHNIGRHLGRPENGVLGVVDAVLLIDAVLEVGVIFVNFPAGFQFH